MMRTSTTLPVSSARKRIFSIMKEIRQPGTYYTLTERGIPRAVIISSERFEALSIRSSSEGFLLRDGSETGYAVRRKGTASAAARLLRDGEERPFSAGASDEESKAREEGYIKSVLFVELIDKHGYPLRSIELGRYVQGGGKSGKRYIEADMLVGDRNGDIVSIFEVAPFDDYEKSRDAVVSDLYEIADAVSWRKRPRCLIYYSRSARNGLAEEKVSAIDCRKYPDFKAWKKGGRICEDRIPDYAI